MRGRPPLRRLVVAFGALLLAGCLEVEQHPPYVDGHYNGKPDNLATQVEFHGSRLSWNAAITNRNHLQNEYLRMPPPANRALPGSRTTP
jgi:hypothetical protein